MICTAAGSISAYGLPSSSLEAILQRFAPKRMLDQTIRVSCWPYPTSFHRSNKQSKELYDSLDLQLFAVIDEVINNAIRKFQEKKAAWRPLRDKFFEQWPTDSSGAEVSD